MINDSSFAGNTTTPANLEPTKSSFQTSTLTPSGLNLSSPYLIFGGSGGVWLTNPDGSFLTQITSSDIGVADLRRLISPGGDRLALVVGNEAGLDLIEVRIPSGESKTLAHLLDITNDELVNNPTGTKAIASYAIKDSAGIAWQPGSDRLLAFTGALDGPTADLYLYDTETGDITQLTDGPSQAIYPNWSPDGKYILHYGVSWTPPFGGAIVGYNRLDGVWAVRVSDSEVIDQPVPSGNLAHFVGWLDESHYITFDRSPESADGCYYSNLRSIDMLSGEYTQLMEQSFYSFIAHSPANGTLLFSSAGTCPSSPGEGVFLLMPRQSIPTRLHDKRAYEIEWLPESAVFQAYPEALFSADGSQRYDPPVYNKSFHPAISIQGYQAWEVIENRQGRVVIKVEDQDWQTILDGHVGQLIWNPVTGDTLLIALQDGSLYSATYPDFSPRLMGNLGGQVNQAIWLP